MLETETPAPRRANNVETLRRGMVVIWIDWYAYHITRFGALLRHPALASTARGIELVGGVGVHAGLNFRSKIPAEFPVDTLFPRSSWSETGQFAIARALWNRLNQLDPDTVLVPGYYTLPGIAAALWGKLRGRRTILMTESTEGDHTRVRFKEWVKGALVRFLFDWAVAGGTPHRQYLERLGFRPDRIARFYDVVDNDFYRDRAQALRKHATAAEFDLPENYFLYVGRLAEEKNVAALLDAYLGYRQGGGSWGLVLVGDGPERARIEAFARQSEFGDDVYFPGLRSTAELPQYYAFAGCFVLPSRREPWGLVVNEAMASGLPVIVSDRCGCAADLVREGENGCVFDPETEGDLTACLRAVAGQTPEALEFMGERSAAIIAHFTPEAWAAEVARISQAQISQTETSQTQNSNTKPSQTKPSRSGTAQP